jgi:WD40 repeat protein
MKQLHIWNASQETLILSQPADSRMIWALASYPEVRLLTAGAQPSVRYWRYKDGKLEHVFDLKQPIPTEAARSWFREPTFTAADFTPDARYAVACDREGGLHLWSLETGRRLRTLRQPGDQLNDLTRGFSDVQVTPDGQFAFTADRQGYIRLWFIGERP